jgi:hypothetical protein
MLQEAGEKCIMRSFTFVLARCYGGGQIKEAEMGGTCCTCVERDINHHTH